MKVQRLASYGPAAAYVSAASLFLFFVILVFGASIAQAAPGVAVPMTILYILAFWLCLGGLAVVVFDLEWLEHPATSTRWFQVAQWATLVALVVPVALGISLIAGAGAFVEASFFVTFIFVGTSLLIQMSRRPVPDCCRAPSPGLASSPVSRTSLRVWASGPSPRSAWPP